ncbi:MAG TPA: hypothetical protein VF667_08570, partial [Pseudonocardia sp.]
MVVGVVVVGVAVEVGVVVGVAVGVVVEVGVVGPPAHGTVGSPMLGDPAVRGSLHGVAAERRVLVRLLVVDRGSGGAGEA